MKISVIIPTKNEPLIQQLIKEIHDSLTGQQHEIIVVDKSEKKPKIVDAKLITQKSDGLGKAVIEGLNHADGDVIVVMDGDFSHDPNDIEKLVKKLDKFDIVIGSRFVEGGKTEDKTHRKMVSYFFRKIASSMLDPNIEDTMSGFSAVKREVFNNLIINPIGYKINMEIIFKGMKKGYKVCEVPIIFHPRRAGKSKAGLSTGGLKESFRILRYIFELKTGFR